MLFFLRNDQNFFQVTQLSRRLDYDLQEFTAFCNSGYGTKGQSLGKNLVAAAGQHSVSKLDFLFRHDLVDDCLAGCFALQHTLKTGLLENGSHSALLVVDQQDLRGTFEDGNNFPDDPLRGDDRHRWLNSVPRSLVDENGARLFTAA